MTPRRSANERVESIDHVLERARRVAVRLPWISARRLRPRLRGGGRRFEKTEVLRFRTRHGRGELEGDDSVAAAVSVRQTLIETRDPSADKAVTRQRIAWLPARAASQGGAS